jgi:hypothetical protein
MDGVADDTSGFPLSAYCCILFQAPLAYVNQSKALVARKGYYRLTTTNTRVNQMIRLVQIQ